MAQQSSVEWLVDKLEESGIPLMKDELEMIEESKEVHKKQLIDELIGFQIFLNAKGSITDYDWDFEKVAKQYVKKTYKK